MLYCLYANNYKNSEDANIFFPGFLFLIRGRIMTNQAIGLFLQHTGRPTEVF
jgi:hypothetical protein